MRKIFLIFLLVVPFFACKPKKSDGNEQAPNNLEGERKSSLEPFPHADPRDSVIVKLEFRDNSVDGIYSYEIVPKLSSDSVNPNLYCYDICSQGKCQPQKCTARLTIILEGLNSGVYQVKVRPCFYAELTKDKDKSHKSKTPEGKVIYWYHESTTTITILGGSSLQKELAEIDEKIDAESAKFLDLLEASDDPNDASLGAMLSENIRSLDSQIVADLFRANFLSTLDTLIAQLKAKGLSQPGTSGQNGSQQDTSSSGQSGSQQDTSSSGQSGSQQDTSSSGQAPGTSGIGNDEIAQTGHVQEPEVPGEDPGKTPNGDDSSPPPNVGNNDSPNVNNNSNNGESPSGGSSNENSSALEGGAIAGITLGSIATAVALYIARPYFSKARLSRYWQAKRDTTRAAPTTAPLLAEDTRENPFFMELEQEIIKREKRRLAANPGNRSIAEAAIRETFPERIANAILGGPADPATSSLVAGVKAAAEEAAANASNSTQAMAAAAEAADAKSKANTNMPEAITNPKAPADARTLYDMLEINEDATLDQINKKYKSLALRYHPDRTTDPKGAEKMAQISEATEILRDEFAKKTSKGLVEIPYLSSANPFKNDLNSYKKNLDGFIGPNRTPPAWLIEPTLAGPRQIQYRDWLYQAVDANVTADADRKRVANAIAQKKDITTLARELNVIEAAERNLAASKAFAEAKLQAPGLRNFEVWLRAGNNELLAKANIQLQAARMSKWPGQKQRIAALQKVVDKATNVEKEARRLEVIRLENELKDILEGDERRAAAEANVKNARQAFIDIEGNNPNQRKGLLSRMGSKATTPVTSFFRLLLSRGKKLALAGAQTQAIEETLKEIERLLRLREAKIIELANLK